MLELHCHTTFSDGTLTPTQLVEMAHAAGVKALAITDHDTMNGWDEAIAAARPYGLEIVPGLELSTSHNDRSMHILGFYPDRDRLSVPLKERMDGRKRRAQGMADKLAALGYPITLPNLGPNIAPGRPHIAKALIEAGHVRTHEEAFERFLDESGPAYIPYEKFTALEGITLLRQCGAIPVWAHPYLFRGGEVKQVLPTLVRAGLMGLEVFHPSHSPHQVATLKQWCAEYGLLMTGGSDYHGPAPDERDRDRHGESLNSMHLPLAMLEALKDKVGSPER